MNWKILSKGMMLFLKVLAIGLYFPFMWLFIIKNSAKILDYYYPGMDNLALPFFILIIYTLVYIYKVTDNKWSD